MNQENEIQIEPSRWEDLPELHKKVFRDFMSFECCIYGCRRRTHYIVHGLHAHVCGPSCLHTLVQNRIRLAGLEGLVKVDLTWA